MKSRRSQGSEAILDSDLEPKRELKSKAAQKTDIGEKNKGHSNTYTVTR